MLNDVLYTHGGLACMPLWRTKRQVAGGTCVDIEIRDPRTTITRATVNRANIERLSIRDAIEWAAVDKENGFIHLTAGVYRGHAHGLGPVWDGIALNARAAKEQR